MLLSLHGLLTNELSQNKLLLRGYILLVSIKFRKYTTNNIIIKVSVYKYSHVLVCNTINFLAYIKVSNIYPIANFAK